MFILIVSNGRLGNRLFMLATVIAMARECGHSLIDFSLDEYCELFDLNTRRTDTRFLSSSHSKNPLKQNLIKALKEVLFYIYFHLPAASRRFPWLNLFLEVVQAPSQQPVCIDEPPYRNRFFRRHKIFIFGDWYTRAPTYAARHRGLIAGIFRMKPEVLASNDILENQLRGNHDLLIGVVIRREDYKEHLNGRYYYSDAIYIHVMRSAQSLLGGRRTGFFICSIDPEDLSAFSEFALHYRHGHPTENLDFLSRCDYIISPPSTYAMWASYIGAKPIYLIENPDRPIQLNDFQVLNSLDT